MATCKECIHFSLCEYNTNIAGDSRIYLCYDEGAEKCSFYKPTADIVEVVRCKDCIFSHKAPEYHLGYVCKKPLYYPSWGEKPQEKLMQDCDYCSHGVRKID